MRAISRTCDVSINTVTKLLEDAGKFCLEFHDRRVVGLTCQRVQCDEILTHRIQLTTDGLHAYVQAVETGFGGGIDYAQLVKAYGPAPDGEHRYSPPEVTSCTKRVRTGLPDPAHISTSYVERFSMRMHMRRFTRLTNAHSKKLTNHRHAISLYFTFYNWTRIHKTFRMTPAMAAGLTDHVWTMEEIIGLMDEAAPKPGRPTTYKKRVAA
jgi:hypothetical protein